MNMRSTSLLLRRTVCMCTVFRELSVLQLNQAPPMPARRIISIVNSIASFSAAFFDCMKKSNRESWERPGIESNEKAGRGLGLRLMRKLGEAWD